MSLDQRKLAVRKLTAAAFVIFEILEIVEDTYPQAAAYLRDSMTEFTDTVDKIVVDAYRIDEVYIPLPRIEFLGCSSEDTYKRDLLTLEQLARETFRATVDSQHTAQLHDAIEYLVTANNMIALIDRANLEPEGEVVGVWEVLNPGEHNV